MLTSLKLVEYGIPTPDTCIAFKEESSIEAIKAHLHYPTIIKPLVGSWGRLIARLDDYNSAMANLECRETMGNAFQKIYYLQKYIPTVNTTKPTDIRLLVIGNEPVAAMGRFSPENEFRSNLAIGGTAKPYPIDDEIKALSLNAKNAVKGEIVGVDLMEEDGQLKIIEVNGTPQFRGISTATKIDIAEKMVGYLLENYA